MITRCERTGNPSGTDTWAAGYACPCQSCSLWLGAKNERARIVAILRREAEERAAQAEKGRERCPDLFGMGGEKLNVIERELAAGYYRGFQSAALELRRVADLIEGGGT